MPVTPVQTPAGLEPAFDLATYYPILIYAVRSGWFWSHRRRTCSSNT